MIIYYVKEKINFILKYKTEKTGHMVQLLWNYLTVHVYILQLNIPTPRHMLWRNLHLWMRRHVWECLLHFQNSNTLEITQCPSTGKWVHFRIEYFTAMKINYSYMWQYGLILQTKHWEEKSNSRRLHVEWYYFYKAQGQNSVRSHYRNVAKLNFFQKILEW